MNSSDLKQKLLYYGELAKSRGLVDEIESMRRGMFTIAPATPEYKIEFFILDLSEPLYYTASNHAT